MKKLLLIPKLQFDPEERVLWDPKSANNKSKIKPSLLFRLL